MTSKMDPTEASLAAAAAQCNDCLCWLDRCEAACCRSFHFTRTPTSDIVIDREDVRVRIHMTPDLEKYYTLHGIVIRDDVLVLPRDACEVSTTRVTARIPCTALQDDHRCRLHPEGKPEVCKAFDLESARSGAYWLPPRCLYLYKTNAAGAD